MRSPLHWPWPSREAWRTCTLVSIPCCTPSSGCISETPGAAWRTMCQRDGPHAPPLKCAFPCGTLWMARPVTTTLCLSCDWALIKGKLPSIVADRLISISQKWKFSHHLHTFMLFQTGMTLSFVFYKRNKVMHVWLKQLEVYHNNLLLLLLLGINYWYNIFDFEKLYLLQTT